MSIQQHSTHLHLHSYGQGSEQWANVPVYKLTAYAPCHTPTTKPLIPRIHLQWKKIVNEPPELLDAAWY